MKKFNQAAAMHLAVAALKVEEVPVGHHDLARVQLVITLGEHAAVERPDGDLGDGFDVESLPRKVSLAAALLFAKKCGISGEAAFMLWSECIRATVGTKADEMPAEAMEALKVFQKTIKPDKKKTSAKRIGVEDIQLGPIERLTIAEFEGR